MGNDKKLISINPDYLKLNNAKKNSKSSKVKTSKATNEKINRSKTLKKNLIHLIKEQKKKQKIEETEKRKEKKKKKKETADQPKGDFLKSMDFFKDLKKNKKEKSDKPNVSVSIKEKTSTPQIKPQSPVPVAPQSTPASRPTLTPESTSTKPKVAIQLPKLNTLGSTSPINLNSNGISISLPEELQCKTPTSSQSTNFNSTPSPSTPNAPRPSLPIEKESPVKIQVDENPETSPSYKDEPVYGCLKKGKKPTFRTWKNNTKVDKISFNKTEKTERSEKAEKPQEDLEVKNLSRKDKLKQIRNKLRSSYQKQNETAKNKDFSNVIEVKNGEKKYKIKKYNKTIKLGKDKDANKVSVLIKDKETVDLIADDIFKLKNTPISSIKDYLRSHKLNESGSKAPQDVLRTMYEEAVTCGNLENTNKEVLIHNYLADE